MRFYIPGTLSKKEANGEDAGSADEEDEEEEQNAANFFYETLMDKAQIGDVAGTTIATFPDILHLTPRGRFDIRHVRKLIPTTWQDLRLQDSV